jgi:hypothetical protein
MVGDDIMTGEEGDVEGSGKDVKEKSKEDIISEYIGAYIDSYMDYVEELNVKESEFPLFYINYPFDARGYILPDNSACILFSGLAPGLSINVMKKDYKFVDGAMAQKRYHHICCYPPAQSFTKEEAKTQARADVKLDIEYAKSLSREDIDGISKAETLRSLRLLSVAFSWLKSRNSLDSARKKTIISQAAKFQSDNLELKKDEDFSLFSKKIRELEISLLGIVPPPPKEKPKKEETKKEESANEVMAPPPPLGTNINIEIKQPDAQAKEELLEDRTDLDILRLKKTLYIQTTDIEELRRKVNELTNKMATYEQLRQTVFRINRKVYDTDARMVNVEKSNREVLKKIAESRAEQREENKKTRRFIIEKTKSARNQAMVLGIAAIGFAVVVLVIAKWEEVRTFLGI